MWQFVLDGEVVALRIRDAEDRTCHQPDSPLFRVLSGRMRALSRLVMTISS